MILFLPYPYEVTWIPPGARSPRTVLLKGEVPVDVACVARSDTSPAFECATSGTDMHPFFAEGGGSCRVWRKRLYRPLVGPLGQVHVNPFAEDVGRPGAEWVRGSRHPRRTWDPLRYPTPMQARSGLTRHGFVLGRNTLAEETAAMGWSLPPRILTSNEKSMREMAPAFLARSLLVVDGFVHLAVGEPVIHVDCAQDGGRGRLTLLADPSSIAAEHLFRVDRTTSATEWLLDRSGTRNSTIVDFRQCHEIELVRDDLREVFFGVLAEWIRTGPTDWMPEGARALCRDPGDGHDSSDAGVRSDHSAEAIMCVAGDLFDHLNACGRVPTVAERRLGVEVDALFVSSLGFD